MRPLPYLFRRPLLLIIVAYVCFLVVHNFWRPQPAIPDRDAAWYASGNTVSLLGTLAGEPDFRGDRFQVMVRAANLQMFPGAAAISVRGLVRVTIRDANFSAGWGDRVELRGPLIRPPVAAVPGGFDARELLSYRGANSQMLVSAGDWRTVGRCSRLSPFRWIGACRRRFLSVFENRLGPHASALLSGLLLGKKPVGFPELENDFRRSGTYHLLVASGSNVGFWVVIWLWVARWLLVLPRRWIWGLAIPWAFAYAALAGGDPPVVRAAVMISLGILAYLCAREDRLAYAVGLSAGILLAVRPRALFEAGFQMSYVATFGVVLGVPALEKGALFLVRGKGVWQSLLKFLTRLFLVSFAAQLALSPLLIHYFHKLSWVGLLSNMLAVPWAAVCVALGISLVGIDVLLPFDGMIDWMLAGLTEKAVNALARMAHIFADFPGAEQTVAWDASQVLAGSVLVTGLFLAAAGGVLGRKKFFAVWLCSLAVFPFLGRGRNGNDLSVTWLNVGLGDSVVIVSPDGKTTVLDGGSEDSGRFALVPYLRSIGCERVDRLILSHGDPPHAGGLRYLLKELPVGEFYCTGAAWQRRVWADLRQDIEKLALPRRFLVEGDRWEDGGAVWTVLSPGTIGGGTPDEEGLVLHLGHRGQSVLLTADVPPRLQNFLYNKSEEKLSVLQWPHHGRVFPDFNFLASWKPQWIVVSGNKPGPIVSSYSLTGRPWLTGRDGTIVWRTGETASRMVSLTDRNVPLFRLPAP